MNRKRNLWIFIGIVIIAAALVSGFILMQPSAQDILVQTLETAKTIQDGHAIVAIDLETVEEDASGTIEIWAAKAEDSDDQHQHGAFRMEVLETNQEKAQGAVIVSDGETLWAYSPSENKVFVGTPEEAQAFVTENESMMAEFGKAHEDYEGKKADYDHPETAEEAVARLLEYFNVSKAGSEDFASETTNQLIMEPIAEQMPEEYIAVGGILNLWVGQDSNLPLAVSYTGGSMGEFSAKILEYQINAGIDEVLFTFDIPAGAEVVTFSDLEPQSLTLEEAVANAEFDLLTPMQLPEGATLVDIQDVRGAIVRRYTLPDGGSFTIAQAVFNENSDEFSTPSSDSQTVEVRGTAGSIRISEDSTQVLLTWTEGELVYLIAGDLTPEAAMLVTDSLQ
jgi:outer membrane lipoprotein-sorting protein